MPCFTEKTCVVLGTLDITEGKNIQRFTVKSRIKHQEYKKVNLGNDIMLLKLSKKVKLGKNVKSVKIPIKDKPIGPNTKCIVAGWGSTGTARSVTDLRVVSVSTIDLGICREQWEKKLPANIICAGGYKTESGACQGDSGGPLVCSKEAVGIVSFNYKKNCTYPNRPNVYTQISKFLPWIKKYIKNIP
ncbi:anionic trypsin-2-like [Anguilla rostrata]|uniref:anionic trypsin-2-like n=1 Tax=Anguilla rostrata TaxID=7938 RepID=UPI0030D4F84D